MAVIRSRVNLTSAKFSLISRNQGQSVIVGQADLNYTPGLSANEDGLIPQNDRGIPQIIYCENVMPFEEGLQAVRFGVRTVGPSNYPVRKIFQIYDTSANSMVYFSVIVSGVDQWKVLIYYDNGSGFALQSVVPVALAGYIGGLVTVAYVNGQSYMYFEGATNPCRQYNRSTDVLTVVTLTNFAANLVTAAKGIFASNGYLCGWSATRVTWSSTVSVTDFLPSLATGAGVTGVQDAASEIMVCKAHSRGAIIYTRTNAVGMVYTNNKNFPWNFRDIAGAGGCETEPLMTRIEDEQEWHYAYTTYGLQKISPSSSKMFLPEVTDFLAGKLYEQYDAASNLFIYTQLTSGEAFFKKIAMVASRYLCISYGLVQNAFEFVLIIDVVTKRWGKIKFTHVEVFEWQELTLLAGRELPRQSIALLTQLGEIQSVDFAQFSTSASGILILGRYQYVRARNIQLQKVSSQNINHPGTLSSYSVKTGVSMDGQSIQRTITGTLLSPDLLSVKTKVHGFENAVGLNHTLVIEGAFFLNSMTLEFNNHGRN